MKAGWYRKYGEARDVIEIGEIDLPEVGANEVRVRLHASGVNPSDVKKRRGYGEPFTEERIIPHSDGAGVIEQAGAGVEPGRIGERVWVFNGQYDRPYGTAAEYIVLPVSQVVPLPANIDYPAGACLGIPAMTAHRCLFAEGPISGQTILVTGGAGAVGHAAVQLAKWGGAKVIATVSSPEKDARARQAGADQVINYRTENVVQAVRELTDGAGVDRIVEVDLGGNLAVTQEIIQNNGTVAVYASAGNREPVLPVYAFLYKNVNLRHILVYNMPRAAKAAACADINRAVSEGKLNLRVAARYSLDQLAAAHERVESGEYLGTVIIDIE